MTTNSIINYFDLSVNINTVEITPQYFETFPKVFYDLSSLSLWISSVINGRKDKNYSLFKLFFQSGRPSYEGHWGIFAAKRSYNDSSNTYLLFIKPTELDVTNDAYEYFEVNSKIKKVNRY